MASLSTKPSKRKSRIIIDTTYNADSLGHLLAQLKKASPFILKQLHKSTNRNLRVRMDLRIEKLE